MRHVWVVMGDHLYDDAQQLISVHETKDGARSKMVLELGMHVKDDIDDGLTGAPRKPKEHGAWWGEAYKMELKP